MNEKNEMEPFTFRNQVKQNRFQPVTKQGIISIKLSQAGKGNELSPFFHP